MGVQHLKVPPERLTRVCDPDDLGFETTEEVAPLEGSIGQERAISALELALDIDAPGFNLFISGFPGTGRNTAVRAHLERIASARPVPPDWGYVHNFQDSSQPVAISLPCGMMRVLARDMDELVDTCRREIPSAFDSDDYTHRVEDVMKQVQEQRQAMTDELEQEARKEGFTVTFNQVGITPVPLAEGRAMTQEEFGGLSDEVREELRGRGERVQHSITHAMQEFRRLNKEALRLAREVDTELVRFTLTPIIDELQAKYADHSAVVDYLDHVEGDMVEHLDIFKSREEPSAPAPPTPGPATTPGDEEAFVKYRVNDLVDNTS